MPTKGFQDRSDAGRQLAQRLEHLRGTRSLVLALPRGGVPVAHEIARRLGCPLDVFLVRKLGVPGHEELAFGAIASGGVRVFNPDVVAQAGLSKDAIEDVVKREMGELERREALYRAGRPPVDPRGYNVVVVDDGVATGATMRAGIEALKERADSIVVAVPVASPTACEELAAQVDEVVCLVTPPDLRAIGFWYEDFSQTSDAEVSDLIERHAG